MTTSTPETSTTTVTAGPATPAHPAHTPGPEGPSSHATARRSRENTRARLLEAAVVVVSRKGIEGARIDDLVREAGFTRGAFYSNYSSMDEVVREAIIMRSEALVRRVRAAVDAIDGPPSVDTIVDVLEAIRGEGRTMFILTTEYTLFRLRHPEAEDIPLARREQFSAPVAGIVKDTLTRMGRRPTLSPETLADLLAVFFLDYVAAQAGAQCGSQAPGRPDPTDGRDGQDLLRHVVNAIVVGLSVPSDTPDDAGPAAPQVEVDGTTQPCSTRQTGDEATA